METALGHKSLIDKLNDRQTVDSLERLLDRLPSIVDKVERLDQLLTIGESVLTDEAAIEKLKSKLDHTNIDLDTLESGIRLLEKLPFLLQATEKFEQVIVFLEEVMNDEKSINYLLQQAEGHVEPIRERISQWKKLWDELKLDAENNKREITVFTIIKWIKDPQVQRFLSYVQAFLNTIPNQANRKEV